jgi:hydrogenase expression/formation protein HypD
LYHCVRQLETGGHEVENRYRRAVHHDGNRAAQDMVEEVFEVVTRTWRGIGEIGSSGLGLRAAYAAFDAARRFPATSRVFADNDTGCISGLVLQGIKKPPECPHFAKGCTPESPLGATMVSSEGACAAYYRYRRHAGA